MINYIKQQTELLKESYLSKTKPIAIIIKFYMLDSETYKKLGIKKIGKIDVYENINAIRKTCHIVCDCMIKTVCLIGVNYE